MRPPLPPPRPPAVDAAPLCAVPCAQASDRLLRGMQAGSFPFGPLVSVAMSIAGQRWFPGEDWLRLYLEQTQKLCKEESADWGDKGFIYHLRTLALFGMRPTLEQLVFWVEEVDRKAGGEGGGGLMKDHEVATCLWALAAIGAHIKGESWSRFPARTVLLCPVAHARPLCSRTPARDSLMSPLPIPGWLCR